MFKNFDTSVNFYVLFIMTGNSLAIGFILNVIRPEITYWPAAFYSALVIFGLIFLCSLVKKLERFFSENKIRISVEKK